MRSGYGNPFSLLEHDRGENRYEVAQMAKKKAGESSHAVFEYPRANANQQPNWQRRVAAESDTTGQRSRLAFCLTCLASAVSV